MQQNFTSFRLLGFAR